MRAPSIASIGLGAFGLNLSEDPMMLHTPMCEYRLGPILEYVTTEPLPTPATDVALPAAGNGCRTSSQHSAVVSSPASLRTQLSPKVLVMFAAPHGRLCGGGRRRGAYGSWASPPVASPPRCRPSSFPGRWPASCPAAPTPAASCRRRAGRPARRSRHSACILFRVSNNSEMEAAAENEAA